MGKLLERDYYEPYDTEEDITKKVKVGVPYFNGRLNPTTFADWLSAIDEPFFFIGMTCRMSGEFGLLR